MNISHKSSFTQVFRLMLYGRGLHPELFSLHGRRTMRHGDFEVESWITQAGHIVRFQANGATLTEAVLENGDHLPETGLLHALPCLGEKEYEVARGNDTKLGYVTTIQTESLTDNLYMATYREIRESGGQSYEWKDADGGPCLSLLDTQKYKKEFHIQSYHLIATTGMVLRTQSIFEVL